MLLILPHGLESLARSVWRCACAQLVARLDPSHAFFDLVAHGVDPPGVLRRAQECLQPLLATFERARLTNFALCPSCLGAGRWWAHASELGTFDLEPLLRACQREEEQAQEQKEDEEEQKTQGALERKEDATKAGSAGVRAAKVQCNRCRQAIAPRAVLGGLRRELLLNDGGTRRRVMLRTCCTV